MNPRSSTSTLPAELNLLTLNCWGLLHISTLRTERLLEIGRQLTLLNPLPDIVCLQECWVKEDFKNIHKATKEILPFAKFYHSGAFGGGLVLLSRWPIEGSSMVGYPLNGRPTAFFRGDWYVGKGIASAKIRIGPSEKDVVEVFNTHTHAPYPGDKSESYTTHRLSQTWTLAKHLRTATQAGHLALALGDFNTTPLSLAHRLLETHAPVRDVWRVIHPDSSLGKSHHPAERARNRPIPTAQYNIRENGVTSDGAYNTWRWSKTDQKKLLKGEIMPVRPDEEDPNGYRLDYIFAGSGDLSSGKAWVVKSVSVEMRDRHPELHCSLSDHFAVQATLALHPISDATTSSSPSSSPVEPSPSHPYADYDSQVRHFQQGLDPIDPTLYDDILARIKRYSKREKSQRFWRGLHFWVSVLVWFGCLVAVWWSPRNFVAFILMLVASLGLAAGVIDGLLSLLFFSWEIRALKEFKWEIVNAQHNARLHQSAASDVQKN